MENVSFSNRTKLAIDLAKKSGEAILQISRNGDMHIKEKGIKDVLTIADTTSEEIIIKGIKEYFDNDSIIAEEGGNCQTGSTEYTWVIDPLFVCEQGKGSYCNGKRLQVSAVSELDKSLTTIGFNNRFPEMTTWFSEIHKNAMDKMQIVEKLFSTVISLCYVAAGKTEAHMELYCYLWDICVGSLLIEEAGGKVSAEKNTPLDFLKIEKQVILGTNRKIHNEFSDIIGTNSN